MLTPSSRIGPYEVMEPLGAGGMGEVYRARDTRLERDVALKVLPPALAVDADRVMRFTREAKTLAALSHPHIAQIYGIEEARDVRALVMELVPGETLAERLLRGVPPLREALDLARQIADGLAAAHERGIVHRDLKPANIQLTPEGVVKILDFGLAKVLAASPEDGGPLPATLLTQVTAPGSVVGTPAYMSPEQARGQVVDKRADVWAFGCVLFELLGGRRAFGGATAPDILAAVLEREPDWDRLPAATPAAVRALAQRCLRKDPRQRLHDTADAQFVLEDALVGLEGTVAPRAKTTPMALMAGLPLSLALATVVVLGGTALLWRSRGDPSNAGSGTFVWTAANPLTSFHGSEGSPSFSPDGSQVAFHWNGPSQDNVDVYVTGFGGGEPIRLTTEAVAEGWPAWSPDGRRIALLRQVRGQPWELLVMPALGGTARLVGRVQPLGLVSDPNHLYGVGLLSWTPDGHWIAVGGIVEGNRGIWLFEADGGGHRQLSQSTAADDMGPAFSADGRRLAFVRYRPGLDEGILHLLALGEGLQPTGVPVPLVKAAPLSVLAVAWEPGDRSLVYAVGSHHTSSRLWRVRLDADTLSIVSQPELLAVGDQATGLDIAPSGRLVYVTRFRDTGLWRLDLTQPDEGIATTNLPASTFDEFGPAYSPDGTKLMFVSTRSGTEELWIANADGSDVRQVTSLRWCLGGPQWSPDGTRVAFNVFHGGRRDLYLLDVRTTEVRPLTSTPEFKGPPHWSPDGAWLYFGLQPGDTITEAEVHRVPSAGGPSARVTQGWEGIPSRDGRWLFVYRVRGGRGTLWQVPLDGGPSRQLVEGVTSGRSIAVGRRAVYFTSLDSTPLRETSIREIDIASGLQRRLGTLGKMSMWWGLALSPDERTLIVSAVNASGANLMVVEPRRE